MNAEFGEMLDTSPAKRRIYYDLIRALTPEQRAAKASRLSHMVRELALVAIRRDHPTASEHELLVRLAVRLYGRDLAARFYGAVPENSR